MARIRSVTTLYHLVDRRNWASVQKHGLLSARRLMQAYPDYDAGNVRQHRAKELQLPSGTLLRDQRPMPTAALQRCLRSGVTPDDWFELLNSKVFFWVDPERLNRQRLACGMASQVALVIDAARLLADYGSQATVTPFNTGNALRAAVPRNFSTFVPYSRWVREGWAHEKVPDVPFRLPNHRPVEVTISEAVPDVENYVIEAIPLGPRETLTWERLATAATPPKLYAKSGN